MDANRLVVGILIVALAANTSAPAMAQEVTAQDLEQFSEASLRHADSPEYPKSQDDALSGCCQSPCNACPCVYGQLDVLFMWENSRFGNQPIVVDPNTNTTFLSTSDLNSNFDPGVRAEKANINGGLPYLLANPPPN